jgi:hypothetical protein
MGPETNPTTTPSTEQSVDGGIQPVDDGAVAPQGSGIGVGDHTAFRTQITQDDPVREERSILQSSKVRVGSDGWIAVVAVVSRVPAAEIAVDAGPANPLKRSTVLVSWVNTRPIA